MSEIDTRNDTMRDLVSTLEQISETKSMPCKICGEEIDVSDCSSWGEGLERLAEHGENEHPGWDSREH